MSENVREPKDLDIIIQIQNAIGKLINDVERDEKQYELNLSQYLNWKNSLTDAALSEASGLVVEHEASLSKRRKHIDAEQKAVAEVIETLGENILNCTLIEIQSILKQDNLSFSGKKLLPVWVALLRGFHSLRKPDITPTLIKEVQSFVDDGLIHPAHNEVKRHFALSKAHEIITGCRELNNQQQTVTAADQQGAELVKAGKAKSNTAKAAVYLFLDKHINDSNSRFFVLKESQGKGTYQKELADLHTLFMEEHSEIKIKADTFKKNYLNEWRQPPKK